MWRETKAPFFMPVAMDFSPKVLVKTGTSHSWCQCWRNDGVWSGGRRSSEKERGMSEKGKGRRRKQGRQPVAPDHQTASRSPGAVRTDGAELGEPTAEAGQRLFLSVFIFLLFFSLTVEEPMREWVCLLLKFRFQPPILKVMLWFQMDPVSFLLNLTKMDFASKWRKCETFWEVCCVSAIIIPSTTCLSQITVICILSARTPW